MIFSKPMNHLDQKCRKQCLGKLILEETVFEESHEIEEIVTVSESQDNSKTAGNRRA